MNRCSLCPNTHRQVQADGPEDATIMVIGEGPGKNEDKEGVPFVGNSGQELNHTYLKLAGLDRSDVFVTNCVQCRCERGGVDSRPSPELVRVCAQNHLWPEIWSVDPKIIILCGATACSLVGDIDLELEHGFPREVQDVEGLGGWSGTVVPMYHPAAGLHETRFMIPLLEDFERLGLWLKRKWRTPNYVSGEFNYRRIDSERELRSELEPHAGRSIALDTETDEGKPYSIQASAIGGHGWFLESERRDLVRVICRWAESNRGFVFHNAPFDIDILERCGGWVGEFRDTQQELYHLGNYPQGLKQAVYRIFGYRMTSYDEVVTPHSKAVLKRWLEGASEHARDWMSRWEEHPIGKGCPTCGKNHRKDVGVAKAHPSEAVLRRVLSHLEGDYDPWQQPTYSKGEVKFRLIGRGWLGELEEAVGRMPRKSIVHAPIEQQIQYAVGDSDWTGRLATWLEGERERIVKEEWEVAA